MASVRESQRFHASAALPSSAAAIAMAAGLIRLICIVCKQPTLQEERYLSVVITPHTRLSCSG